MENTIQIKKRQPEFYRLPLLIQGSPVLTVLSGFRGEQTFSVANGRGNVYAVDILQSQLVGFPSGVGGSVDMIAGGQSIFENCSADGFAVLNSNDRFVLNYTPLILAENQTSRLIGDATTTVAGGRLSLQQLFFYTFPEQTEYVNKYKRFPGLMQKRISFRQRIGAAVPPQLFTFSGVVPKNRGSVVAVSLQLANSGNFDVSIQNGNLTLTLLINSTEIIDNVNAQYFNIPSFKRPQVFPVLLAPGSTFELQSRLVNAALGSDLDIYVTFYFGEI